MHTFSRPSGTRSGIAGVGLVAMWLGVSVGVALFSGWRAPKSPPRIIWGTLVLAAVSLLAYLSAYQRLSAGSTYQPEKCPYTSQSVITQLHSDQTFGLATDRETSRASGASEEERSDVYGGKVHYYCAPRLLVFRAP